MLNPTKPLIVGVLAYLLTGCDVILDDQIDGPYRLLAIDLIENVNVCYDLGEGCIGRIPETVFAVGWNEDYVVGAVHPNNDRSKTEYFYVIRALDGRFVDPSVAVRGPYDAQSFEQEQQRLQLPAFSRELASLK